MDEQFKVRQFMVDVKGLELPRQPTVADWNTRTLCLECIDEEFKELLDAVNQDDIVEIAHELTDLLYVCYQMANAYGLVIEPIFSAIHQANMAKKGGPISPEGKQLKPDNWKPADVASLVNAQQFIPVSYDKEGNVVAYIGQDGRIVGPGKAKSEVV